MISLGQREAMTNFLKMLCLAVSIVAALVTGPALSAFDPANDDTDLNGTILRNFP